MAHHLVDADQQRPRRAALLGCTPDVLTQMRLCRRPGAALPSRTAADDVSLIAGRFGLDAAALRRVVEEGTVKDR